MFRCECRRLHAASGELTCGLLLWPPTHVPDIPCTTVGSTKAARSVLRTCAPSPADMPQRGGPPADDQARVVALPSAVYTQLLRLARYYIENVVHTSHSLLPRSTIMMCRLGTGWSDQSEGVFGVRVLRSRLVPADLNAQLRDFVASHLHFPQGLLRFGEGEERNILLQLTGVLLVVL